MLNFFCVDITADTEEAAEKIRKLIARIIIYPVDNGVNIELFGRLSMLFGRTDIYPTCESLRRG